MTKPWQPAGSKPKEKGKGVADPTLVPALDGPLPHEVKVYLVEKHALFTSPAQIRKDLAKDFGIRIDDRTIDNYNPDSPRCRIGRKLQAQFHEVRKAYTERVASHGLYHQAHRLALLTQVVEKATNSRDYTAALKGLELAAKEVGGALTGQQTVRHEGMIAHVNLSPEEARAEVADRLRALVDGGELQALPTPEAESVTPNLSE